jgi:hypothetical protein
VILNYELKRICYEAASFSYPLVKVVRKTNKNANGNERVPKRRGPTNTRSEERGVKIGGGSNRAMSKSCTLSATCDHAVAISWKLSANNRNSVLTSFATRQILLNVFLSFRNNFITLLNQGKQDSSEEARRACSCIISLGTGMFTFLALLWYLFVFVMTNAKPNEISTLSC